MIHLILSKAFIKDGTLALKVLKENNYVVNYARCPILGFDFAIGSLSDLTDGLRLARIAEIVMGDHSFQVTQKMNRNPKGEGQKILNLQRAIVTLQKAGVVLSPPLSDHKALVKGDPDLMVRMVSAILYSSEFPFLIDMSALRDEIQQISPNVDFPVENGAPKEQILTSTLLLWCRSICSKFMEIRDFSSSFADGKAFCYIFNHYHPEILPFDTIKEGISDYFPGAKKVCYSFEKHLPMKPLRRSEIPVPKQVFFDKALRGERYNFSALENGIKTIECIPNILNPKHFCNSQPDEAVVITFVAYLCSRLLNLKDERYFSCISC